MAYLNLASRKESVGNLKIGGKLADVIPSVHATLPEAERWE